MNLDSIPGYAKALALEEELRGFAFLDLPQAVCGVPLKAPTLRQAIALINIRSPFFVGGRKGGADVAAFLWFLSPGYNPADRPARAKFLHRIARKRLGTCIRQIDRFLDDVMLDAPPTQEGPRTTPFVNFAARLVETFAVEYGWSESAVLDLPLPRLFQYLRLIELRRNPKTKFINRRSSKVRGNWFRKFAMRKGLKT
jgi:hypothetical protein